MIPNNYVVAILTYTNKHLLLIGFFLVSTLLITVGSIQATVSSQHFSKSGITKTSEEKEMQRKEGLQKEREDRERRKRGKQHLLSTLLGAK